MKAMDTLLSSDDTFQTITALQTIRRGVIHCGLTVALFVTILSQLLARETVRPASALDASTAPALAAAGQ